MIAFNRNIDLKLERNETVMMMMRLKAHYQGKRMRKQ
jgi:hypothetical protein